MRANRQVERCLDGRGKQHDLPRIDNRAVTIHGDEAHYRRSASAPRHPDASYSIPDRNNPGMRIDIILLMAILLILVTPFVIMWLYGVPL
jgi:hypothetical protein